VSRKGIRVLFKKKKIMEIVMLELIQIKVTRLRDCLKIIIIREIAVSGVMLRVSRVESIK